MKEKCNDALAWKDGGCCCNCKNQLTLTSHPWNKDFGKGSILEVCGYACTAIQKNAAVFFESKHGYCEMHDPKPFNHS